MTATDRNIHSAETFEAVRPHKYVPQPIITQFTDDPGEIMKGMRTPFITTMKNEYHDPDVDPEAFTYIGKKDPSLTPV